MKKSFLLLIFFLLLSVTACKKTTGTAQSSSTDVESPKPVTQTLTGENGEKLSVEYFEDNSSISVKIVKDNQTHILRGKSTSDNGNPLFSDGIYVWEIQGDAQSGKLTDKSGRTVLYK